MNRPDTFSYFVAVLLGALAGIVDVRVGDLLFTALIVLASCMAFGALRPRQPWRWVLCVCLCVPLADLLAYLLLTQKPDRVQVYESFLVFLPGLAGAYGGSLGRKVVSELLSGR